MILSIKNLLPAYFEQQRTATSEIWGKDIVFNKGELVKIVAPSGSGKTSLMHFLYGMRSQYNGQVLYDNKSLKTYTPEDFAQVRSNHVSIVFQDMKLLPESTVLENLEIKRQLNPFHDGDKVLEMAKRLGIDSKLPSKGKTCSYGEQQRVAIIRSLLQPFDYLLLDEPFSHLDNANAQKAMELIIEEARLRKATVILADLEKIGFYPYTSIYYL